MTDKEKKIIGERLSELFMGETQEQVARKLNTTQGNISKWINGQYVPPTETIYVISKRYGVSVDWILGVSNKKEIDGILYEELNYEQAFRMLDRLLTYKNLVLADLTEIHDEIERKHEGEHGFFRTKELDEEYEDEENELYKPEYSSDYIKISDRLLSFLMRKRRQTEEIDPDLMEMWKDSKIPIFKGLKVMDNTGNMEAALDAKGWTMFVEGDWISNVAELQKMTEAERAKWIEELKIREKKGK